MSIPRNLSIIADTLNADGTFFTITDTGNLTFTGTGNRITGDFSNATQVNRVFFQTSTVNGGTVVGVMPNGTGTTGQLNLFNNSDPANASLAQVIAISTETTFRSAITGTGTYLPMTFYTGGSERMRLDTSGNLGIGTSSGSARLNVNGGTSTSQIRWEVNNAAFTQEVSTNAAANAYVYKSNDASYHVWKLSSSEAMRIDSSGNVGIGTSSPASSASRTLTVQNGGADGTASITAGDYSSAASMIPMVQTLGNRYDGNQTFGGRFAASFRRSDSTAIASGHNLGYYAFGGQWGTDTTYQSAKLLYAASIIGVAEGSFTSATAMPTAITFCTGSTGGAIQTANTAYGTERMRIDSSGNVGIGTTSPSTYGKFVVSGSSNSGVGTFIGNASLTGSAPTYQGSIRLIDNPTSSTAASGGIEFLASTFGSGYGWKMAAIDSSGVQLTFATRQNSAAWTEAMRIDSSGNLLVGTTATSNITKLTTYNAGNAFIAANTATSNLTTPAMQVSKGDNNTTTSNVLVQFLTNGFVNGQGQINANGASAAAFGSFSDKRLKENIVDLPSQLEKIMALRPVEFDYVESIGGGHQIGFIAQEVETVYPDLVGVGENEMLTLTDLNKNDARLIKCIQEQQALITSLTARITALEST